MTEGYIRLYNDKGCREPFELDFGEVELGDKATVVKYMRNEGYRTPDEFKIEVEDSELKVDFEPKPRPKQVYPVVFEWTPTVARGQEPLNGRLRVVEKYSTRGDVKR